MTMRFLTLAETLEALEPVSGRLQMIAMLADLLQQAGPEEVAELVYLTQGRLLPDFIQKEFGMNERLIFRSVAQACDVAHDEVQASFRTLGDAGLVASEFAQRCLGGESRGGGLSLHEVYSRLMEITQAVGAGSQERKVSLLAELLKELSPLEAKHVTRIVVGRLRVGVGDPTLMEALSSAKVGDKSLRPPIERAYNLTSDLGLVARTFYSSGVEGLEKLHVNVGNPVRMALAERANSAEEIIARLGKCAIEPKFDGFRMQIHKDGSEVSIFSRGLENLSGMFPEVVAAVNKQMAAHTAIMEGEALAYDPESGVYQPFQVTSQRRRIHNIEEMSESHPLRLMAFDLLLLDERDLTRAPYTERREALINAINPHTGHGGIMPSDCLVSDDPEAIVMFYEESLTEGLEGIMAKRLDGTYEAGKRGFNWIKMKRSYQSQLRDTVDCVIVGYYYGKGQRAKWGLGSLLVALYDKENDTFPTVTRVASGLSNEAWQEMYRRLKGDEIAHADPRVKYVLQPDVWVVPRIVLELQADEVSRSQMHAAGKVENGPGYALRFPRIVRERTDREPEDATSVDEIIKLHGMQGKGDTRGKRKSEASDVASGEK
jgi:DNA ligase-1